jgi:hypothetical protein
MGGGVTSGEDRADAPTGPPDRTGTAAATLPFRARFWPVFLAGLIGIASLPLLLDSMVDPEQLPPELAELPRSALVAISLLNPLLLLVLTAALGAALAHRAGLESLLVSRRVQPGSMLPRLRASLPAAIGGGLFLAPLIVALDRVLRPLMPVEWILATAEAADGPILNGLLGGMLYGGVTEEVMLRWGILSTAAWLLARATRRRSGWASGERPGQGVLWTATAAAAILFGVAHLPAVAVVAPLDSVLVLRTIGLNAIGGLVYGWLYWRYHLEAAIVAHATSHVGFAVLRLAGLYG